MPEQRAGGTRWVCPHDPYGTDRDTRTYCPQAVLADASRESGAADAVIELLEMIAKLPVEQRMEAMGMHRVDPFEVFTAGDGEPAIRGRTDVWAAKP